jgi:cobalt/nickel transport system permease protein
MHTPDGFLTSWVCVLMLLLSLLPISLALRNLSKGMDKRKALAIGTVSVVIFLAQMLNFPIANGTSGHLIGAMFALLVLGVDSAVLSMALVLIVQAFVYGDGGVFSLGANVFNMAVLGVYSADFAFKRLELDRNAKIFVAGAVSVVAASAACSLELAASGTSPILAVLGAMTITHIVIGAAEGLLTIALLGVFANRLENITARTAIAIGVVSFLALALSLPFASASPDGLERVAIDMGFFEKATTIYDAPLLDYSLALSGTMPYLASVSAALVGCLLVFSLPQLAVMINPSLRAGAS